MVLTGGDDTIDASQSVVSQHLIGDVLTLNSGAVEGGDDVIVGGSALDVLAGDVSLQGGGNLLAGADTIESGLGNDTINGEYLFSLGGTIAVTVEFTGADLLSGGAGNDSIAGQAGNDTLNGGLGNDTLDGGFVGVASGIDTVAYDTLARAVTVDLQAGIAFGQGTDTLLNIRNVTGSSLGDSIGGDNLANTLQGLGGNDTLNGRGGLDTASYAEKTAAVVVTLNGATNATVTVGGVAEDTVSNIEAIIGGSASDTLFGDAFSNP